MKQTVDLSIDNPDNDEASYALYKGLYLSHSIEPYRFQAMDDGKISAIGTIGVKITFDEPFYVKKGAIYVTGIDIIEGKYVGYIREVDDVQ